MRDNYSAPFKVRASDIRNILLILPFILHDLMADEVKDQNEKHPRCDPVRIPVVDPSPELIPVVLQLLSWYHLFRRRNPPKDEDDINDLRDMAERFVIRTHKPFVNTSPHSGKMHTSQLLIL